MNDIANMYEAPQAELIVEEEFDGPALASRGSRLGASMIDGILVGVVTIPVTFIYFDVWENAKKGIEPSLGISIIGLVLGLMAYLLFNGYLLKNNGQTLGKKALGIKVVDNHGNLPPLSKLLFHRYLLFSILYLIPVVSSILPLVDSLFIFRKDKRCIHDLVAGTQVVEA